MLYVIIPVLCWDKSPLDNGGCVLYEQDVSQKWRVLFHGSDVTGETVTKAEALLAGLKPESPLRYRLDAELDEICEIHDVCRN